MSFRGILFGIGVLLFFVSKGQVQFYSNAEPVHSVNSADSENYLYLSADGSQLIFTKEKSNANVGGKQNPGDVWFANLLNKAPIDSSLNRKFNSQGVFNSPIGLTPNNTYFLYNETSFSQGIYTGKVMVYDRSKGTKSEVSIPYFKNFSQIQTGFLSRDGNYLLLSLETRIGYGVEDLYVCTLRDDGTWSDPRNLGRTINTDRQEITPFLSEDNRTLYFATNARGGMGSFDIYASTRLDDSWKSWSEPKNLGNMVNTEGAETSFMFNSGSEYAYFISTQNSDGYGDVKRIRIYPTDQGTPPVKLVKSEQAVVVETGAFKKRITFYVKNIKNEQELDFSYLGESFVNGSASKVNSFGEPVRSFSIGLNEGDSLDIEFKSKGFLSESTVVRFGDLGTNDSARIILLEPLETGNVIVLKNVLFERGTADFLEISMRELNLVLEMMNENPEIGIFLKGHTDNVGNKVLNIQLSQARVNAVKDYLIKQGIDGKRITGKGFGGSKPIGDNRTEATRQVNRRVEFEVIRD